MSANDATMGAPGATGAPGAVGVEEVPRGEGAAAERGRGRARGQGRKRDREQAHERAGRQAQGRGRLALFLRASLFDYVLVVAVASALSFTVSYGFNSAPDLRGNVALIAGVSAVLSAILYAGSWSKRAIAVSAVLYVAAAALTVAGISLLSPEQVDLFVDGQVNDVENNYAVFALVLVAVPPIVYLLSRRIWGVAVLFFLGVLACGAIQFLYRDWISSQPGTIAALVAYVGMGALFMVQGYRQSVLHSRIVKRTAFFPAFLQGVLGAAACAGVGALVFIAVISGLGLTTAQFKPFEDYFSRMVVEYNGTYEQQPIYDPDVGTSKLSNETDYTSDDENGTQQQQDTSSSGFSIVSSITDTLNMDDWSNALDPQRFDVPMSLKVLLVLVPFAVVGLVVWLRYSQRKRRLKKIEQHPLPQRVALLYNFFMDRFKRLNIEKPPSSTPMEFALNSAGELAGFTRNASKADLLGITLIYQRAVYGAGNVTDEEYRYVRDYYQAFFENAHRRMGNPRWVIRGFWRI